jgi:transcriptional regulator with XRE-family HTH domain
MTALKIFAERLLLFLAEKHWNQADLAEKTGLSRPQINNYIKEKTQPGLEIIEKIALAFERPVSDFFKEEITIRHDSVPAELRELWPKLTETDKQSILTLVKSRAAGETGMESRSSANQPKADKTRKSRS